MADAQSQIREAYTPYSFYKQFRLQNAGGNQLVVSELRQQWGQLPEHEKQPFKEQAARDKDRYNMELAARGIPPKATRKKRAAKDPDAPKRPMSAFFLFSGDNRGELKKANPSWRVTDIGKELGRLWANASEETKKKYSHLAQQAKDDYDKKMIAYKEQKAEGASSPKVAKIFASNA